MVAKGNVVAGARKPPLLAGVVGGRMSPFPLSRALEILMILHRGCAERAIAKQINATQAPPENSSQNEQKHLALQHRGQPRTRCGMYVHDSRGREGVEERSHINNA